MRKLLRKRLAKQITALVIIPELMEDEEEKLAWDYTLDPIPEHVQKDHCLSSPIYRTFLENFIGNDLICVDGYFFDIRDLANF